MADHWGRGQPSHYRPSQMGDFYNPPPYEELNRPDPTYTNDDYNFIPDNNNATRLLARPYISSTNRTNNNGKHRSPPPLPPRSEQSMSPQLTENRRGSNKKSSPPTSITPPSTVYSASTAGTYMAPNLAALRDSGSLALLAAENSSTSSSGDSHRPSGGPRVGNSAGVGHHRLIGTSGRSTSQSPNGGDSSSAHSSSLADGAGGYLMRTDSGNLFISPPQPDQPGDIADSPETMRTSVGGAVTDITPLHHGHFGTTISHDSAVATTNTTGGGTMSSRTKPRRPLTSGSSKFQEKMFESVPIRLANIQMSYDPTTGVTRPLLYHTDFRSYSALLSKFSMRCRTSWKCFAIIFLILLIIALAGIVFFALHFFLPNVGFYTGLTPGSSTCSQLKPPVFTNLTAGLAASRPSAQEITVDLSNSPRSGVQFKMTSPDFVAFDIVSGATPYGLIGVYGRRFAPPTRYRYDFFKLIDNSIISSTEQGSSSVIYRLDNSTVGFVEHLDVGQWFLLFVNDDNNANAPEVDYERTKVTRLGVNIFRHGPLTTGCPADCHGRGFCDNGPSGKKICQCRSDYTGYDCSMPICPIVCSGRGRLVAGPKCFCDIGWKGSECQIEQNSCEDPSCSGHGQCFNGVCRCQTGYGGTSCEKALCPKDCSSPRGVCVEGKCYCHQNYAGPACSIQVFDKDGKQILGDAPEISSNEQENKLENEAFLCKSRCKNGRCTGEKESICECFPGFNGRFCSIEGCPKNCSNHGRCITASILGSSQHFACHCDPGWKEADCSVLREKCSGGVDEDGDSLIDCADPDCCTRALCSQTPTCATVPNPILELLSLPVLPPNSPFSDRVSFLLRGVQRGIPQLPSGGDDAMSFLDQKRVSVVAGNVLLAKDKSHLVGVKIYQMSVGTSSSTVHLGYTLSREQGGAFDLLVEGGGVVWIRLEHPSKNLCPQEIAINVGWNEFKMLEAPVLIEPQQPGRTCDSKPPPDSEKCQSTVVHDHAKINPSVFTTWQSVQNGAIGPRFPFESTINPELNDPVEMLPIGDTGFSLYWLGSFARTRLANIVIRMTPEDATLLPDELTFIKVQIAIEGVVEERLFEAEPDLKYTFSWSGKNRFNSESAGVVRATVRIGYIYKNCTSTPVWIVRRIRVLSPICAPVSPPFAGWFLSGQHHFDPQNSILYRSDGSVRLYGENLYLRRMIGQPGRRRLLTSCTNCANNPECRCEGPIDAIRLSRPRDMTADRSGNLIVLDDNVILRILPGQSSSESKLLYDIQVDSSNKNTETMMELVAIAVHPTEEAVYVADKRGRRVFKVIFQSKRGLQLVAGSSTGQICSAPEQQNSCGDGLPGTDALLIQPKSLAFDKFGNLFIADGHVVRKLGNNSKLMETYLGSLDPDGDQENQASRCWKNPVHRKNGNQLVDWPVALAVNPLDDTLYVADVNNVIYQVTPDDQVIVVAGRAPNCGTNPNKPDLAPENFRFRSIRDIYFSLNGDLYILQSKPAEVLLLSADRVQIRSVTGQRCSQSGSCVQAFNRTYLAQSAPASAADLSFTDPTSLVALPNGALFIADAGDSAIYALEQNVPTASPGDSHYDVYDPDLDQIHRFDAIGNHKMTISATTGVSLLSFTYHTEGSLQAPLSKVTNPTTGYELTFSRTFVENSFLHVITQNIGGQQFSARVVDASTPMEIFVDANNRTTVFTYTPESMLLRSIQRPDGQWVIYDYDANTRLIRASTSGPTRLITIQPQVTEKKGVITSLKSPSSGDEIIYSSVGGQLSIDKNGRTLRKINRIASSVWLVTTRDNFGAVNQVSLVDSRSSGTAGLDGRNWVSLNGNMSVEWRRTSPPSSGSSTMVVVGQLLRQLRVTDWRLLSASTTISRGISMQLRGFNDDNDCDDRCRQNSFMLRNKSLKRDDHLSLVNSVAQNIVLIAHLNRTSQPQRETFFNLQTPALNASLQQQSAVQLLFITYDEADRAMQIKPAHHKFPTVRLAYVPNCRRGRLTSVKFGDVESAWQPDQRGLLKLRTFSDGRSYQFAYLGNSTQLQSVAIVGGKELINIRYDSQTNGFQSIQQNNQEKFTFRAVQGLDFSRRILNLPGFFSNKRDLEIVLDRGLGFTRTFTVGTSESTTTASFAPESGSLTGAKFSDGNLTIKASSLSFNEATSIYKNPDRQISLSNSKTSGALVGAKFNQNSSNVLSFFQNLTTIEISMPEKSKFWLSTSVINNPSVGLKVSEFGKIEKVHVGNWTILHELDTHGRLVHVTLYEPNSRKPLVQSTSFYEIVHQDDLASQNGSPWRVARTLWHVLASNELYAHVYEWTPATENSMLKSVKVERSLNNGKSKSFGTSTGYTWSLPSGNLVEVKSATSSTKEIDGGEIDSQTVLNLAFTVGSQDQLQSVTGIGSISYDSNGCISQIGSRNFVYNSLRQLVQVNSAKFSYDAFGRFGQIFDKDTNLAVLYHRSSEILISADFKSGQITRYHYSPVTGCIDGFQDGLDGPLTVVLTDPWCSPTVGLNSDGTRVLFPSLSGSTLFAGQAPILSSSNDQIIIGYHGFVQLRQYGIIFIDQTRPVDTLTGRFLCPDFASLLSDDPNQPGSLPFGRDIAISNTRNSLLNLFQFAGPDASRTNFHLLSLDDPSGENFAGNAKAWLAKILAPISLLQMSDDALLVEQKPSFTGGQLLDTLTRHHAKKFGVSTRAEMATNVRLASLSSLSASTSQADHDDQNWPIFVPPPSMTQLFAHPALSRVSLMASFAFGNAHQQAFELIVFGKVPASPANQYQPLLKIINVVLNGTFFVNQPSPDQARLVPDMLQYDLVKANQSVTLQSDLALLSGGHQVTCTDRANFGSNFDVSADCARNVFILQTSPSHIFTVHYGVNVKERYFNNNKNE